ncbi:type II toxin-antitoxin system HipA family toxin [Pararobbsia silviterrae]|uniref:Type II toxin-antitoxin system HipA family toxin n=1 Tax=Pararobbsia silviterrae TaxID=1792498 RepID=A0A494Y9K0_9BURK|nr:type II toxin-antitoxin system HipA family toxin [Pararobbsia silviterrae]RKP56580.1 type II toxin-antitoxin system HipA family toxin [Pararobbsia silviterrae]
MTTRVRELSVGTPQGVAGTLTKASRHVFAYATRHRACEVSLTMPLRAETYAETPMLPAFSMNRPEGFLLERIQRVFKQVQLDDMALLAITGENQIGRLRYAEPGKARESKKAEVGLSTVLATGSEAGLFEHLVDAYLDSGISGFQPKVMIPDADKTADRALSGDAIGSEPVSSREEGSPDPGRGEADAKVIEKTTATTPTLILKAAGDDHPHLPVNEYLCMSAARRAGIRVPRFWLSDDLSLFVMERFDVVDGVQFGFEDMAVLMGKNAVQPNFKYSSSYENVARVIALNCGENTGESLARFFEYFVLSVLVRNGDAHLKNFGLIYTHPDAAVPPSLSPVFDVVTTSVYRYENQRTGVEMADRTMALKLNKSVSYPTRDALIDFGRNTCHVAHPAVVIERIADAMSVTLNEDGASMSRAFRADLRAEWDAGRC